MASDRLFEALAEARSRPSRASREAQAALGAIESAGQGYLKGAQIADVFRNRRLQRQTLVESLGALAPSELADLPTDQANNLVRPLLAWAQYQKATRPERPSPPGSLDAILANRVNSGELSIENAARIKRSFSPSIIEKPPTGYESVPGGLRPIPGGPAFVKTQADAQKEQTATAAQNQEAGLVIGKIDSALSKVNNLSAGVGSYTKNIPGTPAMDLSADIDTILSSLGLGKLMEMKNISKAGASGMGQLSDKEMTLLTSALTSLKQAQSPPQLMKHLNEVKTHYQNVLKLNEGVNPFGNGNAIQGGSAAAQANVDHEAEAAIARVQSAGISENEKKARITAIRARASQGR